MTVRKSPKSRVKKAQRKEQKVKRKLMHAQLVTQNARLVMRNEELEEQIAELQRQLAMLKEGYAHTDDADETDAGSFAARSTGPAKQHFHRSVIFLAEGAKTAEILKYFSANSAFSARNPKHLRVSADEYFCVDTFAP